MRENFKHNGNSARIRHDDVHNRDSSICMSSSRFIFFGTKKILITSQLPLSFFTSLFGMNVRDWTGDERNSTLHRVMILMGSASAAIIVIALLAAFFPLWFGGATKGAEKMKKLRKKVADASPGLTRITRWQRPEVHEEMEEELSVESEDEKDEKSVVKEAEAERTSKWFWPGWSWGMRRT